MTRWSLTINQVCASWNRVVVKGLTCPYLYREFVDSDVGGSQSPGPGESWSIDRRTAVTRHRSFLVRTTSA
jgi:hypothetical protein